MLPEYGKRGFTLLEILVVITVLAVMVMLMFSGWERWTERAYEQGCTGNLRDFGQAFHLYAGDYAGKLPPYRVFTPQPDGTTARGAFWREQLKPYLHDTSHLCPAEQVLSGTHYGMNASTSDYKRPPDQVNNIKNPSYYFLVADAAGTTRITGGINMASELSLRHSRERTHLLFLDMRVALYALEQIPNSSRMSSSSPEYQEFWRGQ